MEELHTIIRKAGAGNLLDIKTGKSISPAHAKFNRQGNEWNLPKSSRCMLKLLNYIK